MGDSAATAAVTDVEKKTAIAAAAASPVLSLEGWYDTPSGKNPVVYDMAKCKSIGSINAQCVFAVDGLVTKESVLDFNDGKSLLETLLSRKSYYMPWRGFWTTMPCPDKTVDITFNSVPRSTSWADIRKPNSPHLVGTTIQELSVRDWRLLAVARREDYHLFLHDATLIRHRVNGVPDDVGIDLFTQGFNKVHATAPLREYPPGKIRPLYVSATASEEGKGLRFKSNPLHIEVPASFGQSDSYHTVPRDSSESNECVSLRRCNQKAFEDPWFPRTLGLNFAELDYGITPIPELSSDGVRVISTSIVSTSVHVTDSNTPTHDEMAAQLVVANNEWFSNAYALWYMEKGDRGAAIVKKLGSPLPFIETEAKAADGSSTRLVVLVIIDDIWRRFIAALRVRTQRETILANASFMGLAVNYGTPDRIDTITTIPLGSARAEFTVRFSYSYLPADMPRVDGPRSLTLDEREREARENAAKFLVKSSIPALRAGAIEGKRIEAKAKAPAVMTQGKYVVDSDEDDDDEDTMGTAGKHPASIVPLRSVSASNF